MDSMSNQILVLFATTLVVVCGVFVVRRWAPHAKVKDNHEFAGLMYQLLGLVYGVYLAFTIIAAWERFGDAERTATNEAAHLSELWRDAQSFEHGTRDQIQARLYTYTRDVVEKEWPSMAAGQGDDSTTVEAYDQVWESYYAAASAPRNNQESAFYAQSIQELNEMGALRRVRLLDADAELPGLMWGLLTAGGVVTIAFMFVFGTRIAATQYIVSVLVAAMLVLSILVVGALEHPYQGDVSVKPGAFVSVLQSMDRRLARERAAEGTPASAVGQAGAPRSR